MKKVLALTLAVCLLLTLAGCGGTIPSSETTGTVSPGYCGTWKIDHVVIDGAEFASSELEVLDADMIHMQIVIKDGGKAYITEDGTDGDIVDWSETDVGILLDGLDVLMVDGLLRLKVDDDEIWYFQKVSDSQLIEQPTQAETLETSEDTEPADNGGTESTAPEVISSSDAEPVDGEVYVSGNFEFVHYTDGSIELTKYTGSDSTVDISTEIGGYPVSRIGSGAFENCNSVETIYMWAKVVSIGEAAFRNCSKLESFDIPSSVTTIADSSFENCSSLENIYIWGKVTSIGSSAFQNCTSLESVDIPSSCTAIGESAFEGCTNLESVYFWGNTVSCGANAFANCPNLKDFPDGMVYAKSTSVEIPESSEPAMKTDSTLIDGMRPEFKEAMDAYEAFYNEYCDFMVEYKKKPTDLTLITKYGELLTKAVEVDEAFAAWDEDNLNNEELKYYLEVNTRVMQKLVDVAG